MLALLDPDNRLFVLARRAKRLPGWFLALTMSGILFLVGGIPASIAIALLALRNPAFSPTLPSDELVRVVIGTPVAQLIMLVLGFAPVIVLLWAWLAFYEQRPFWTVGFERAGASRKAIHGALIGLVAFSALVVLLAVTGAVAVEQRVVLRGALYTMAPILMLVAWSVQGPAEEILLRGWLMPVIGAKHKPWLGVALSSVTFAAFHGLNLSVTPLALLNLFLTGVLFSTLALREGGLWGACAFHAAWNWVQGNVFGFEVSGTPPAGGTLINLAARGPPIWTGGSFGPEGGLAATIVITIATVLLLFWPQRKV